MVQSSSVPDRLRRRLLAAWVGAGCALALFAWAAPATAAPVPSGPPLKIGIIGTGRIGGSLARHWAKAGHELMISSRHPDELRPLAAELGPKVRVGTPEQAAAFGDVILVSVPYGALPQIGNDYSKQMAGKVIIDTSNPLGTRDEVGNEALRNGVGVTSAAQLHTKRLVRAFNCINSYAVTTDSFRPGQKRAVPIGGDDAEALAVATRLVGDAGFDAVVVGSLESTRDFELGGILANRDWSVREFQAQMAKMKAAK